MTEHRRNHRIPLPHYSFYLRVKELTEKSRWYETEIGEICHLLISVQRKLQAENTHTFVMISNQLTHGVDRVDCHPCRQKSIILIKSITEAKQADKWIATLSLANIYHSNDQESSSLGVFRTDMGITLSFGTNTYFIDSQDPFTTSQINQSIWKIMLYYMWKLQRGKEWVRNLEICFSEWSIRSKVKVWELDLVFKEFKHRWHRHLFILIAAGRKPVVVE